MIKKRPIPLFAAMLATALLLPAQASVLGNEASTVLVKEGDVLLSKNQYEAAYNKYEAATKLDPGASIPISSMALTISLAASSYEGNHAAKMRQQSEDLVRKALLMEPTDPVAQEVLRLLQDKPAPLHAPTKQAWQTVQEGEVLFHGGKYAEALAKYEQAAALDPLFSVPWVYAGDCFFAQKNWHEAELRFRKATEVEPLNGQAWRFLSDALMQQGKKLDAESALLSGIAAQPSQMPNWEKLAQIWGLSGVQMQRLQMVRKSQVQFDKANNKYNIYVDSPAKSDDSPDTPVWLAYALSLSKAQTENMTGKSKASPFSMEVAAWRIAMIVADEINASTGKKLTDAALQKMQTLAQANQLEPAILLLMYSESYRPEFESWKKANPNGIRAFVNTYGLRP
ncbi:tetratricopeptide repeat protein [Undibacterium terreum]|uniref:Tetratricopeptide repeat-containing protein n=1 Tax=Undibacterium terreum TaxID=1224302 RepID=A0A916U8S5_9BURK|nr:tetratricopeptide repeat protein [Undibacterium terreum]GGC64037.1 hypothetical protein GCM10011396_08720 [Undibacterium terreum]